MAEQALLEQMHQDLLLLIDERDTLRTELQYAHSTIDELRAQTIELNRLCTEAQTRLLDRLPAPPKPKPAPTPTMPSSPFSRRPSTPKPSRPSTLTISRPFTPTTSRPPTSRQLTPSHPSPSPRFFPGTPSLPPTPSTPHTPICETYIPPYPPIPLLAPAESLWRAGRPQHALNALHPILSPNTSRTSNPAPAPLVRTHALLLRAAILLAWDQAAPALTDADEAWEIARERGWFEVMGRAQFYRGLGAVGEGRWGDARWCFGLSWGVRGYEGLVEWWGGLVGRKLGEDGRRRVEEDHRRKLKGRGEGSGGGVGKGKGKGKERMVSVGGEEGKEKGKGKGKERMVSVGGEEGKEKGKGEGKEKGKGKGKERMVSAEGEEGSEGHRTLMESWGWI